jgi:hypothetical protein
MAAALAQLQQHLPAMVGFALLRWMRRNPPPIRRLAHPPPAP